MNRWMTGVESIALVGAILCGVAVLVMEVCGVK
jgi:hypothetical protein